MYLLLKIIYSNNLLEPLLIIVVGLILGFILVAMYLLLFRLGGGFV
jgi:type II secretory pathway component PulF